MILLRIAAGVLGGNSERHNPATSLAAEGVTP
jgi:hypothetical protein